MNINIVMIMYYKSGLLLMISNHNKLVILRIYIEKNVECEELRVHVNC